MNIKTIGIFAVLSIFMAVPAVRAEEESYEETATVEYADYEDYEVFDDVEELIDEELNETAVVADDMGQVVVDTLQRHPVVIDGRSFPVNDRLDTANEHQRCDIDWDVLEYHHRQNRRGEKENQYVAQPAANCFHNLNIPCE